MTTPVVIDDLRDLIIQHIPEMDPLGVTGGTAGDYFIEKSVVVNNEDYLIVTSFFSDSTEIQLYRGNDLINEIDIASGYSKNTFILDVLDAFKRTWNAIMNDVRFAKNPNSHVPPTSPCQHCDAFKSMFGGINHEKSCPTLSARASKMGYCLKKALNEIKKDPSLKLMMGPPGKGEDTAHFWTVRKDGTINDPASDVVPDNYIYEGREITDLNQFKK